MTLTTPPAALKGSRTGVLSFAFHAPVTTVTNDITRYFIGNSTTGLPLGHSFRLAAMYAWVNVTADSVDATLTITAYKGSVAAGNRALELSPSVAAIAEVAGGTTAVIVAGKDVFGPTDQLILRYFVDATADSLTVESVNVTLIVEWDI